MLVDFNPVIPAQLSKLVLDRLCIAVLLLAGNLQLEWLHVTETHRKRAEAASVRRGRRCLVEKTT
jgi:hypothetical protein